MAVTYTITDLAREFGVTTRTIRHYEEQGLLNPTRQGTNRVFSARDRVRLKLALRAKRLGLSLQEMRELFALYDVAEREAALSALRELEQSRHLTARAWSRLVLAREAEQFQGAVVTELRFRRVQLGWVE